jgi:hypothetical protein
MLVSEISLIYYIFRLIQSHKHFKASVLEICKQNSREKKNEKKKKKNQISKSTITVNRVKH